MNTWRLAQHYLSQPLKKGEFVEAATRTGGIQAQVLSAAELALAARVRALNREDVQKALWQDHTLLKTWVMRGTLHLLPASELPLYIAARSRHDSRNWKGYFAYFGISPEKHEALLSAVPQVLGSEPMTREQLAAAIAEHTGAPELRDVILQSSWGSPLKQSAFRGDLAFGPSQGQNVTFVNPRAWIGHWPEIEPDEALREMVRRYLLAYGPATPQDFALWWWGGGGLSQAKKTFRSMAEELEEVDVEGWRGSALYTTVEPMQSAKTQNAVHLLPLFDAYTLGIGRDIEPLLPKSLKLRVYRPQGWISAVVLVNGFIKGVWQHETRRAQTAVKVSMFLPSTASVRKGIETEAGRLGAFLNTEVVLSYEND